MSAQKTNCIIIIINFNVSAGKHKVSLVAVLSRLEMPHGPAWAEGLWWLSHCEHPTAASSVGLE